jgi:hypothetical protein
VNARPEMRLSSARLSEPARSSEPASPAEGAARPTEPCLHCGFPVPVRLMGCKGGHCPNCRHPYPHGDCSD